MARRLVVCFRWRDQERQRLQERLGALLARAQVLGGRLCAWQAESAAFDFEPEALEDAVELMLQEGALPEGWGATLAEGELTVVVGWGAGAAVVEGPALASAARLTRLLQGSEVLVDASVGALARAELLTRGTQRGQRGAVRLRGARLDLRWPLRRPVARAVARLRAPAYLGAERLAQLAVEPGRLTLVRGARGAGGTRALQELHRAAPASLWVQPGPVGEPLGALRRALRRARQAARVELSELEAAALEALLDGQGGDVAELAELVTRSVGAGVGLVLIDDAALVEHDSLEVLALAAEQGELGVVARLGGSGAPPVPLQRLALAAETTLAPFDEATSVGFALSMTGGALEGRVASRGARVLDGLPQTLWQALSLGLERGVLIWEGDKIILRSRTASWLQGGGIGLARSRRSLLTPLERELLEALALLGGDADEADLLRVVAPTEDVEPALTRLAAQGWLTRGASLTSRTLQRALLSALTPEQRQRWHHRVALAHAQTERPLDAGVAALHASLAADVEQARLLARRAAGATITAGLGESAEAFEAAQTQGTVALAHRGLAAGYVQDGASWLAPARRAESHSPAARGSAPPSVRSAPTAAAERVTPAATERVRAIDALEKGETSAALQLLRSGREQARDKDAREQSRAALALAVGLSAAGRSADALLEALEGLARAREASDARGERACLLFLTQLCDATGASAEAQRWRGALPPEAG